MPTDLLSVVRDVCDPIEDEDLAAFVVGSHRRSHPESRESRESATVEAPIPQDLLKKYLRHARATCKPTMANANQDKVVEVGAYVMWLW